MIKTHLYKKKWNDMRELIIMYLEKLRAQGSGEIIVDYSEEMRHF